MRTHIFIFIFISMLMSKEKSEMVISKANRKGDSYCGKKKLIVVFKIVFQNVKAQQYNKKCL